MIGLLLIIGFLFIVGFITIFPSPMRYRRIYTAREDALHNQIQKAMNWRPEHFHQREDGRWFNAYGEEGIRMSLEEFLDREEKNDKV